MSTIKNKSKQFTDLRYASIRSIETRDDYKVLTVAMVTELEDTYETIFKVDGLMYPLDSVIVDYNHEHINTGAKVKGLGVRDFEYELNGEIKKTKGYFVEVYVYKENKLWTGENKDKSPEEVPSVYDAVMNGRIKGVSVEFGAPEKYRDTIVDSNGSIKTVIFNKWYITHISLLDIAMGQPTAFIKSIRAKKKDSNSKNVKISTHNLNLTKKEMPKDKDKKKKDDVKNEDKKVAKKVDKTVVAKKSTDKKAKVKPKKERLDDMAMSEMIMKLADKLTKAVEEVASIKPMLEEALKQRETETKEKRLAELEGRFEKISNLLDTLNQSPSENETRSSSEQGDVSEVVELDNPNTITQAKNKEEKNKKALKDMLNNKIDIAELILQNN